jgi:hypothetical protein
MAASVSSWLGRAGWLLMFGTVLTTASLMPILLERPAVEWLGWLGVVGTLVAAFVVRLASESAFLAASVVGFFANVLFLAALCGLLVHLVDRRKKRQIAQP